MAKIVVEIPDEKLDAVVEAFATLYNYQEQIGNETGEMIDNPVKKKQFANNIIASYVKEVYVNAQTRPLEAQKQEILKRASAEVSAVTASAEVKDVVVS